MPIEDDFVVNVWCIYGESCITGRQHGLRGFNAFLQGLVGLVVVLGKFYYISSTPCENVTELIQKREAGGGQPEEALDRLAAVSFGQAK